MGHGIARTFAAGGWPVSLWDRDAATLDVVARTVERHSPGSVRVARSVADAVDGVEVVVEALPEDLAIKRALIAEVDHVNPDAIVTTNTSVIRISDIAAHSELAHRVVGTHWWNPPHLINLVEVAGGERTDPALLPVVVAHLRELGKDVVVVDRDISGFIGNRMQVALWREALVMLEEGVADAATIDHVVRETFGRRLAAMGPLEQVDYIGLELTRSILGYVLPTLSSDPQPPRVLDEAIAAGATGARAGRGLLAWPEGARDEARERLERHLSTSPAE